MHLTHINIHTHAEKEKYKRSGGTGTAVLLSKTVWSLDQICTGGNSHAPGIILLCLVLPRPQKPAPTPIDHETRERHARIRNIHPTVPLLWAANSLTDTHLTYMQNISTVWSYRVWQMVPGEAIQLQGIKKLMQRLWDCWDTTKCAMCMMNRWTKFIGHIGYV